MSNLHANSTVTRKGKRKRRAARTWANHCMTHAKPKALFSGEHGPREVDVGRIMHGKKALILLEVTDAYIASCC